MTKWLWVVLAVVLFAGALFGYDQGVISGALAGVKETFSLSLLMVQVVTSWVTLGALVGSLVAGELGDRLGRKRAILIAGALFTFGAAIQWIAPSALILVGGRFIIGAGVGMAAVSAPLYAAELAPARVRGRFVSAYQLAITIGIFLAYLVNGQLSASANWRLMLGLASVPGLALFLIALVAPESPRWLISRDRRAEAVKETVKVQPDIDVDAQLGEIEAAIKQDSHAASWAEIFSPKWRKPLLIAVGLAVFQQITGINAIIYYANQIFGSAGFATEASRATVTLWAVGGVNVLSTFIAIAFIDKVGRRLLLLVGLVGMGASLAVVGVAFHFIAPAATGAVAASGPTTAGIVTVVALVVFIASFAFSLGPVVWTVINEIFPAHIRGRGVALATAVNWGSAFLVSQFFLSLIHLLGSSWTFWLLAGFCALGWIWIYLRVPETRGLTLEKIQEMEGVKA
jgi:sugar porter (SP) family MFS transporter